MNLPSNLKPLTAGVLFSVLSFEVAAAEAVGCWTEHVSDVVIDVDGKGLVQGAWSMPAAGLLKRMRETKGPLTLLIPGYDVMAYQKICNEITQENLSARLLFGGRERRLAEQHLPAWEWLFVATDAVASSLLAGGMHGVFVGDDKAVVGRGLSQSSFIDPAKMAAWLIDEPLARREPVVLFVSERYQQKFFEFFANNPLPGVFLSFENAEMVKDVLNRHASIAEFGPQGFPAYFCR